MDGRRRGIGHAAPADPCDDVDGSHSSEKSPNARNFNYVLSRAEVISSRLAEQPERSWNEILRVAGAYTLIKAHGRFE
jgi:hypothetical protein